MKTEISRRKIIEAKVRCNDCPKNATYKVDDVGQTVYQVDAQIAAATTWTKLNSDSWICGACSLSWREKQSGLQQLTLACVSSSLGLSNVT